MKLPAFLEHKYVSAAGEKNLQHYKYHGIDRSLLVKYIFGPFWNWAVTLLPLWMAPNLVTLIGFAGILLSYLSIAFYCPFILGTAPGWVYLFCTFGLFWYQTLDAIDGKQARRTGSSSPLGELFDHGCDAITTTLMGLTLACAVQMGTGWALLYILLGGFAVFFCAQWEEYHTGILDLGYMSVTEIHCLGMFMYLMSFFKGADWWLHEFNLFGYQIPYNWVPMAFIMTGTTATILNNAVTVWKVYKSFNLTANLQLVPITILLVGGAVWAVFSPTQIFRNHPHLFILTIGFIFAYLAGRIVVNRVCKEPFSTFHPLTFGVVLANINIFLLNSYIPEPLFLQLYFAVAILSYLHFALNIIDQMCAVLNIHCLHITPKKVN